MGISRILSKSNKFFRILSCFLKDPQGSQKKFESIGINNDFSGFFRKSVEISLRELRFIKIFKNYLQSHFYHSIYLNLNSKTITMGMFWLKMNTSIEIGQVTNQVKDWQLTLTARSQFRFFEIRLLNLRTCIEA